MAGAAAVGALGTLTPVATFAAVGKQIYCCQTPVLGQVLTSRLRLGVDFSFAR